MEARFTEPDKFVWGVFKNSKGANIRYGHIKSQEPAKGTLIILPGFREPIEKYFETVRDLLPCEYHIWLMDWRGQGGSEHYLTDSPHHAHSEGYNEHIETLDRFMRDVVGDAHKPITMLAHSMGAHIGLRYLAKKPNTFNAAIMTSPMIKLKTPLLIPARLIVNIAKAVGGLTSYIPGGRDWDRDYDDFATNEVTSDPVRYNVQTELYRGNKSLQLGDATYGWLYQTFKSIAILNSKDYLSSVDIPILMQISGNDDIVNEKISMEVAKNLSHCMPIFVPEAKHEIWMERDELRKPWLKQVITFLKTTSQLIEENGKL